MKKKPAEQRLRDRGEHVGGLRSQAEALERAIIAADREIALLKLQVHRNDLQNFEHKKT